MYVCMPLLCLVFVGSEEVIGSPGTEVEVVVTYHVGAGNRTWVLFFEARFLYVVLAVLEFNM